MCMKEIPELNIKSTKADYIKALAFALEVNTELQAALIGHRNTIASLGDDVDTQSAAAEKASDLYVSRLKQQEEKHAAELKTARRERIILEDAVCAQAAAIAIMRARREEDRS